MTAKRYIAGREKAVLLMLIGMVMFTGCMAGGTRGTGLSTNYGGTSGTGISSVGYYTLHGYVTDMQGRPLTGMPVTIETSRRTEKVITDGDGYYRANVVQQRGEPVRFIFINPIGDKVHFQTTPGGTDDQQLDFNIDDRGTIRPVEVRE